MKLNVGCGTDFREGFVNIDGSDALPNVDRVIDISKESLLTYFRANDVEYILANDIVEHHFHWEAVRIMSEFYALLVTGGTVEIRVDDAEFIINNPHYPMELKLNLLFGGQDIPQGVDEKMDESRKRHPEYFCHKYGWTMGAMKAELLRIGFSSVICERADTNFITYAIK